MKTQQMIIQFDGGCHPNPGTMYGSYSIAVNGIDSFEASRIPLGEGTNNEAEFRTLVQALYRALELLELGGLDPACFRVDLLTDSKVVQNRVSGRKVDSPRSLARAARKDGPEAVSAAGRMAGLTVECLKPLDRFLDFSIKWTPREENVARFGH